MTYLLSIKGGHQRKQRPRSNSKAAEAAAVAAAAAAAGASAAATIGVGQGRNTWGTYEERGRLAFTSIVPIDKISGRPRPHPLHIPCSSPWPCRGLPQDVVEWPPRLPSPHMHMQLLAKPALPGSSPQVRHICTYAEPPRHTLLLSERPS
jgi:hypothetical protein